MRNFSRRRNSPGSRSSRSPVGGSPTSDRRAAAAGEAQCRRARLREPDGVEGVVGSLRRDRAERLLEVVGMDGVGGAEPERLLATRLDGIDDDDRLGARDPCALDDELADAAGADHEHDAARLGASREQHGADAGQRCAAEQRRIPQRHRAARRQCDLRRDDDSLGPGARRRAAIDGLAAERHPGRAVDERPVPDRAVERHAGGGAAAGAVRAMAAGRRPREHDLVADTHRRRPRRPRARRRRPPRGRAPSASAAATRP